MLTSRTVATGTRRAFRRVRSHLSDLGDTYDLTGTRGCTAKFRLSGMVGADVVADLDHLLNKALACGATSVTLDISAATHLDPVAVRAIGAAAERARLGRIRFEVTGLGSPTP